MTRAPSADPADHPSRPASGQSTGSRTPKLVDGYDGVICDLDGVVYRGESAVEDAVDSLRRVRSAGTRLVYATNNASRPPAEVAAQLRRLGLDLEEHAVVTSAQAGAAAMLERLGAGARVLAVGGPGVAQALREEHLVVVAPDTVSAEDAPPEGVLQGFGPGVDWADLAEAAYAIEAGALWVATNTDATMPTARGRAPGNGTFVSAVSAAVGSRPLVVGKPYAPLYELARSVLDSSTERTLAIGDRLDTDIAGAHEANMPSLMVLTGVHGVRDLVAADASSRPRFIVRTLAALHEPYDLPTSTGDGGWSCGRAVVRLRRVGDDVVLDAGASGSADEQLRAGLAAAWEAIDVGDLEVDAAQAAVADLDGPRAPRDGSVTVS